MSTAVRYHRVNADDRDTDDGPSEAEQYHTPSSLSWTTLLLAWLLTILVTALATAALLSPSNCSTALNSASQYGDASNLNADHSSFVDRSPCRPLPVTAATPTPLPSTYLSPSHTSSVHSIWSELPSYSLLVRTYSINWPELLNFHFTHSIFWPRTYINSGLVFVLDEERASDRRLGTLLLHAFDGGGDRLTTPSKVNVVYEAMPGSGILSDKWRGSIGYCRQQYSNFYSDLYTDRQYIGIIDTDAYFIRPPNPDDIFEHDTTTNTYRPILLGFNGNTLWCASAEYMIGRPCAGEFMVNFPVTVKRAHFAPMRRHIMAHLNVPSFEVAWRRMLTDVGDDHSHEYSQFTIMATYLWHFHHDEYAWRINSLRNKRHKRLSKLLWDTQNETAMASSSTYRDMATRMAQYDIPTARYVQHPFKSVAKLVDIYQLLCVASNYVAGDCALHTVDERRELQVKAWQQWYTDEETQTERVWVSERYPSVESNTNAVINNMAVYHAGQWRTYDWPTAAREAAAASGGVEGVGMDELSGCRRVGWGSGEPFIYYPHRVSYNASDGTFHEPNET